MKKTATSCSALLASFVCCLLLASCSASHPLQPATAAGTTTLPSGGVYKGSVAAYGDAILLMLFDGTAYLFYGDAPGSAGKGKGGLGGVVVANNGTQSASGQFTSLNAQNYSLRTRTTSPVTFDADFARAPAVTGSVADKGYGAASLTFSGASAPMLDAAPARAIVAGLYSGRGGSMRGSTSARLTITDDGFLAGTTGIGCVFRGTVAPHTGVNAYDVSITFGPAPCPQAGTTVPGNAVLDGARLLAVLPSADRTDAFVFDGSK
ncbi:MULTISPECIES: hypothetical protein [unclassified Caballeronia]|uniref:hypothetical protein n=1 Tax=unclassified Caballeronia TaxID=2646786 RepID=UPI002861B776|nr:MULTISPECIES: hypothetical protein [unclassified Caballeronia]MDR5753351.1 hypothetical protein [Caballeronia sp. LZ024]MDR5841090.1 hypothetical protein [Caballeronia sp. LZ031]